MSESATETSTMKTTPPSDEKINLKLLRVNGQFKTFQFTPSTSAAAIAKHVFDNWPEEWDPMEENVRSHGVLRLIYQGRFLHGSATLGALRIGGSRTTVMHLVCRNSLPEPHNKGAEENEKEESSSCCARCNVM